MAIKHLNPHSPISRRTGNALQLIAQEEIPKVDVQQRRYPNGLIAISEKVAGAASVSVGLWVRAGSQDEPKAKAGIAHFIEHTVFKGTAGKSMREIMRSMESRGGLLNAFTTKEHTCYYTWTRLGELQNAVEILFELAARPTFTDRDIEREKSVVIEEINGLEDEPEELVFDLFEHEIFGEKSPLGKPIIGTSKSVASLQRKDLFRFHAQHYRPENLIVVVSGAQHHEQFFEAVGRSMKHLSKIARRRSAGSTKAASRHRAKERVEMSRPGGQQAHVIFGRKAPGIHSAEYASLNVLITALGVGMSSRLSLRLREELALAYDASAFYSPFEREGTLGIYIATAVENQVRAEREMRKLVHALLRNPISASELIRTKEQMIGGMVLSLESMTSRMMRVGQHALYYDHYLPIEKELEKVEVVTLKQVRRTAERWFGDERKLSLISVLPSQEEAE
jgi:predicted Zn-dependent peptidase